MGRTLTANSNTGEAREPIKPGPAKGVVVGFADIGTQNGVYGIKRQCIVTWEIQRRGEVVGQLSKFYTLSFNAKATLRQDVEAMLGRTFADGETFDPESLIDVPCRLSVVNETKPDGKVRDKIGSLMPLDEDDQPVKAQGSAWYFECPDSPNFPVPGDLPDWIANKVKQSEEFTGSVSTGPARQPVTAGATASVADDDDTPF